MRCCLINPLWGTRSSVSCAPPLGLAYIASVLEKNGHEVKIIDRMALYYKNSLLSLKGLDDITSKELLDFEPQIVGIGSTTIQFFDTKHVARMIRKLPRVGDSSIVVGGYHATAEPELTLKECPEIDIVCRGEGEFIMLDLVSGKNLEDITGLTFRKNGIYSTDDRPLVDDLDSIPMPARHLLDMKFYTSVDKQAHTTLSGLPLRTMPMVTSRGCPYNCAFCAIKLIRKKVRFHSLDYVFDEIEFILSNYKVEVMWMADDMFLTKHDRVINLCNKIIEKGLKFKWACAANVNSVQEDLFRLMGESGCIYVVYGLESGSQKILDIINKRTTVEKNRKAVEIANRAGILVNSAFIVNIPDETEEDFLQTIDFIKNNDIYVANLNNLMPLPGSPFYRRFLKDGTLKYSETLWESIGRLNQSVEEIQLYTRIPRDRFITLWKEGASVLANNNMKKYLFVNWYRDPVTSFEYAGALFSAWISKTRIPVFYQLYLLARLIYRKYKGLKVKDDSDS